MKNILMLDLEGTLVYLNRPSLRSGRDPRPYAQQFVDKCSELFDQIYMNTCANEETTVRTLEEEFGITSFRYHNWMRLGPYQKANGYDSFIDSRIIHVEDGISQIEKERIKELGHHYISVRSWGLFLSKEERVKDRELLRVLDEIKKILGKQNA